MSASCSGDAPDRTGTQERSRITRPVAPAAIAAAITPAVKRLTAICRSGGDLPWATPRPLGQRLSWGSGHPGGALLVAAGLLDGFVMYGSASWDHAATAVIVEEAGGRYSDLAGGRRLDGGGAIFSNGHVHTAIVNALRG